MHLECTKGAEGSIQKVFSLGAVTQSKLLSWMKVAVGIAIAHG